MNPRGQGGSRGAIEIEIAAREAEGGFVNDGRRKNVRFVQAEHLFAQKNIVECDGIAGRDRPSLSSIV